MRGTFHTFFSKVSTKNEPGKVREMFFCATGVGRHLGHPEIEKRKKIIKESKKSEIIDKKRKS